MDAPELCSKGCGFFGSPEQHGMCSKCYKDFLKEEITRSSSVQTSDPFTGVLPVDDLEARTADALELCSKGCGFFGSPKQHGLCSMCYKDYLKEENTKSSSSIQASNPSNGAAPVSVDDLATRTGKVSITAETAAAQDVQGTVASEPKTQKPVKNRCKTCSKRVGLLGFQCRCGDLFCGTHRYPEEHACKVDHKERARDLLKKQNPKVVADRLDYRV